MVVVKKNKKTTKPKQFKLEMLFNGMKFSKRTDNVEETIISLKPDVLYTEVYVIVTKNKEKIERKLTLTQGKRLFITDDFRTVFINNLLLN